MLSTEAASEDISVDAGNSFLAWDEVLRFGTVAAVVWSAAWFLFTQQVRIKDLMYTQFEALKTHFDGKIEYHERHDDTRFENIRKDLISIRLVQAAKTGKINGDTLRN